MNTKKALAGLLLSLILAGGIVAPASVAFATDEVTSVAPAGEVVTEASVAEASVTYTISVQYLDIDTGYAIHPFQTHHSISEGVYTFAPATIAGYRYEGFFYINNSDKGEGSIAEVHTSKSKDGWLSVDFYYKKVDTAATTTEVPKTTEEPKVEEPKVQAPAPVYRLYQPDLKVHLYTKDTNEYKVLATRGWKQEGVAYRSFGSVPVYRLYHAGIRKHLYTKDANEYKVLATRGWLQEGVSWYSQP